MHRPTNTAGQAAAPRPLLRPFSVACTCCEVVEHRPEPTVPDGWAVEHVGSDSYAFCPECAIDMPGRRDAQ